VDYALLLSEVLLFCIYSAVVSYSWESVSRGTPFANFRQLHLPFPFPFIWHLRVTGKNIKTDMKVCKYKYTLLETFKKKLLLLKMNRLLVIAGRVIICFTVCH